MYCWISKSMHGHVPANEKEGRADVNVNNRAGQVEKCLLCTQEKPILRFLPCGDSGVCSECSHNWVNCWKCNSKIVTRVAKVHPDAEQAQTAKRDCVVCTQTVHTKCALYPCGHSNVCLPCAQRWGHYRNFLSLYVLSTIAVRT